MSFIKPLKIGNVIIPNNILLAPLAGVSDVGFRKVCKLYGAGLTCTEMVSAKGIIYKSKNTFSLLNTFPEEKPSAVQIFGSEPDIMAEAVKSEMLSKFDIIDINMGCPVKKVVGCGEGSALMLEPKKAEKIITECRKASGTRPVTVKFRRGFYMEKQISTEFSKMCENAGASLITLHGRFSQQLYRGKSDIGCIRDAVESVKIPVIANGDVNSLSAANKIADETGAAGVMIARAALGNPAVFREITGIDSELTTKEAVVLHFKTLSEFAGERFAVLNIRKHLLWYLDKIENGKKHKQDASRILTVSDFNFFVEKNM